jgi:thiosulfate/3-mercaptopyruvate sulfurtransferase
VNDPRVEPDWIAARLDDPSVRVVEVDVGPAAYDSGHIPGAVLWNAYGDLRHTDYTLVDDDALADLLERSGISNRTTVVFYGYAAHLGYWLMTSRGHDDVRLLDGPRERWTGHWAAEAPAHPRATYSLSPAGRLEATREDVLRGDAVIVDVRSQLEYEGERFWPSGAPESVGRAGRIPGSVHVPIEAFRTPDGSYRSLSEMQDAVTAAGVTPAAPAVVYCTIGNRAAQAWFAFTHLLGHRDVSVYYGSWAEWGMRADTAVES